jgi:Tol biopolymer transport system component
MCVLIYTCLKFNNMLRLALSKPMFIGIIVILILNSSCLNQYDAYCDPFPVSDLTDTIQYDVLGQGKLVFRRQVFDPGQHFVTAYVIDINQKTNFFREYMGEPSISPDGQQIVFGIYSSYLNISTDVYVTSSNSNDYKRVSDIGGVSPSWSSDGTQVVFLLDKLVSGKNHKVLYRQSAVQSPSDRTEVVDFTDVNPLFVPEGRVTLSSKGLYAMSSSGIYTFDATGNNFNKIIPLQSDSQFLYSPVWSPDGNRLAVISVDCSKANVLKTYSVLLFNADGTNRDTLYTVSALDKTDWWLKGDYSVCWSPDGKQLAFTRPNSSICSAVANIFVIRTDHTGLTQLTNNRFAYDYCLSWGR